MTTRRRTLRATLCRWALLPVRIHYPWFLLILLPAPPPADSQEPVPVAMTAFTPAPAAVVSRLFTSHEVLELTLEVDLGQLSRDRSLESEDRPGRVLLQGRHGTGSALPVEVRTRGKFRLQRAGCALPPLRLDFPREGLAGTILDGQNKLKLVTHCRNQDRYEQNVLEEYLAYRIYNLLTDVSLRARLVRVTYVDTGGKEEPVTRFGILLEDENAMAERLGGMILEVPAAAPTSYRPQAAGLLYLFQYLIGNEDWSETHFHNVAVMRIGTGYYPIPYDFDWSGLVDAPYAGPHPQLAHLIDSVRDRLFRGSCDVRADYPDLFALFREKRAAILELVEGQPGLSAGNARSAIRYLEEFYWLIADDDRAMGLIRRTCR